MSGRLGYYNLLRHHPFIQHSSTFIQGYPLSVIFGDPKTSFLKYRNLLVDD